MKKGANDNVGAAFSAIAGLLISAIFGDAKSLPNHHGVQGGLSNTVYLMGFAEVCKRTAHALLPCRFPRPTELAVLSRLASFFRRHALVQGSIQ